MSKKPDLNALIARNLKFFMARQDIYTNPRALALACGVSPSLVRYLLEPTKRTTTVAKVKGFPTLDKLEKIADKLPDCEVWMLLHPDLETTIKAMLMYKNIKADFEKLPAITEKGKENV